MQKKYFRKGEERCKLWKDCKLCKENGCTVSFPKGEKHICPFDIRRKGSVQCNGCGWQIFCIKEDVDYKSHACWIQLHRKSGNAGNCRRRQEMARTRTFEVSE